MGPENLKPAWEYLRDASMPTLQSFELSRLNHAANIRQEIDTLMNQWLEETAAALLARFLIEQSLLDPNVTRSRMRRQLTRPRVPMGARPPVYRLK